MIVALAKVTRIEENKIIPMILKSCLIKKAKVLYLHAATKRDAIDRVSCYVAVWR
jgi:hypothetical protein